VKSQSQQKVSAEISVSLSHRSVYQTLSPRAQLHCRFLALVEGEATPVVSAGLPEDELSTDRQRPWFESNFQPEPMRQVVAKL
jgi:hypothetical protein